MLIGDWNDGFDEVGFFPDGMWSTKPAPPPSPNWFCSDCPGLRSSLLNPANYYDTF